MPHIARFRKWLSLNKILFEVFAYAIVPLVGIAVAVLQYRAAATQADIQGMQYKAQSLPHLLAEASIWPDDAYAGVSADITMTIKNDGGPAYVDDVELIAFVDIFNGDGTDSTCSYFLPVGEVPFVVRDESNIDGKIAEVDVGQFRMWHNETVRFLEKYQDEERPHTGINPTYFVKIKVSDHQGSIRSFHFLLSKYNAARQIGSLMWSRAKFLHSDISRYGFVIKAPHQKNSSMIADLWSALGPHGVSKFCRPIGYYEEADLRSIFLD
jgi:hypothetical protein